MCHLIDFLLIREAVAVKKQNKTKQKNKARQKKKNKTKQNKGEEIGALTEEVWLEVKVGSTHKMEQ